MLLFPQHAVLVGLCCAVLCRAVRMLQLFRLITAMDSDNYPETCHAIYIVNGGIAFGAIWRIVSPFVDKGTRDKVHVVGSGKYMRVSLGRTRGARRVCVWGGISACICADML